RVHRTPPNPVLQRHPLQILHRQEHFSVLFPDVVDRANVWMIQCRCGLRFPLKSRQRLPVPRQLFRQKLQRHKTAQPCVFRLVHHPHPSAAKPLQDAVVREHLPNKQVCPAHLRPILGCPAQPSQRTNSWHRHSCLCSWVSFPRHLTHTQKSPPNSNKSPAFTLPLFHSSTLLLLASCFLLLASCFFLSTPNLSAASPALCYLCDKLFS